MEKFKLNNEYQIICESQSTRYGFRHVAILLKNGYEVDKTKICYYNRTWESFEYECVIRKLINKYFNEMTAKKYMKTIYKNRGR